MKKKLSGRELDAKVAEDIFNWVWVKSFINSEQDILVPRENNEFGIVVPDSTAWWWGKSVTALVPEFHKDISIAWKIIEKLVQDRRLFPEISVRVHHNQVQHWCEIWMNDGVGAYGWLAQEYAESVEVAICRAALEAKNWRLKFG